MATLTLLYKFSYPIDNTYVSGGSLVAPVTVATGSTIKLDQTVATASATVKCLLTKGSDGTPALATYDINTTPNAIVIISSTAGWVELQGASAADNSTIPVLANTPLFLSGAGISTYAAGAEFANLTAGSPTQITRINYLQKTGSAGTVRIVVI